MRKLILSCFFSLLACSMVQADMIDFTATPGAGENQTTALTGRRTNTMGGVPLLPDGVTVAGSSLLEQMNVILGNGVTANVSVTTGNGNAWVVSQNGGLGVSGGQSGFPTSQQQFSPNNLLIFTMSNVLLNGGAVPAGTTVDFDLNTLLYTDPTIGGYVFDGSTSAQFSGINVGVDGVDANTTSVAMFDGSTTNPGDVGSVSSDNLAFSSTGAGFDTIELAPTAPVNFATDLRLRSNGTDTFFLQGLNITANVTSAIPEPSSMALLGLGSLLLTVRRRR